MINKEKETQFLENLFENYITSNDSSYLRLMRKLMIRKCEPYIPEKAVALELGCEIGYMTSLISPLVKHLDVIEGSESFIKEAEKRNLPNVVFGHALFEELFIKDYYDCVFLSHVVEHLVDPQDVLSKVRASLKNGGWIFVTVPNAYALSRQLAQAMGIVDNVFGLTPNDVRGGHRRVYDKIGIMKEIEDADFELVDVSGVLLKPFCDIQMDKLIDDGFLKKEHLEGLLKLGESYAGLCGDIFVAARK